MGYSHGSGARSNALESGPPYRPTGGRVKPCNRCGTGHEGYPDESFGAKIRCLRAQAVNLGAVGTVDQIDAAQRDFNAKRDEFLFGAPSPDGGLDT